MGSLDTDVCWNLELGRDEDPGLELRFAQSRPGKQDLLQSQAAGGRRCYQLRPWASPFPLGPRLPPLRWMRWWCRCDDVTYLLGLEQCLPHRRAQSLLATVLRTVWDPSGFKWWLNPYEWTRWPGRESCEAEESRDPEHVTMFSHSTPVSESLSQNGGRNKSRGCGLKSFKNKFSSDLLNISNHLVL